MKKNIIAILLLCGLCIGATEPADAPQADISNGLISASLYLPDANTGYYQATRFDWAGLVKSLDYKGHSFYGQWFDNYNPKTHDAVTGPVESFAPLNYDNAKPGGTFVDIGVGVLRKPVERSYQSFRLYDIVDGGKWTVKKYKDRVEFTQMLHDSTGYAFTYTKTLRLVKGKPMLVLEHSLKNTGSKAIESEVFDHNFPVIDKEPTGPGMRVVFPFDIKPEGPGMKGWGTIGQINGNELKFTRELTKREQVYSSSFQGLTGTAKDYDFKIENIKTGAGMHIVGDQPLSKLVYWACPTTACPEPYIKISVAPGKEMKWNISYEYYTFTPNAK
jgi:hypothetical protein